MTAFEYAEEHSNVVVRYDDNDVALLDDTNLPFLLREIEGEVNLKSNIFKATGLSSRIKDFYGMPIKTIQLFQDKNIWGTQYRGFVEMVNKMNSQQRKDQE